MSSGNPKANPNPNVWIRPQFVMQWYIGLHGINGRDSLLHDSCGHRRIYHWAIPPPFELRKSRVWQKKCAIFRQKSQKFSGEGAQPPPQTLSPLGREIPLSRPLDHLRRRNSRPPPNFSPISTIRLDSDAVIDEFGKSNRRLVLLVDLGLLNGTR